MAYDEDLANRFRARVSCLSGVSERRMMGGLCFMLDGNMLGGADRTKAGAPRFMFRVGKEREAEALERSGAIPVELGGRRMGGIVFVAADECDERQLSDWITLARAFVENLPAKA